MLRDRVFSLLEARLSQLAMPLAVECWNGWRLQTGDAPRVRLRLNAPAALKVLINPSIGKVCEIYVKRLLDIEGRIADVVEFGHSLVAHTDTDASIRNRHAKVKRDWRDSRREGWWNGWSRRKFTDREAIGHHYDVSNDFYALWLDDKRVYSCAYFKHADDTLEVAQKQKLDHVCRKLMLARDERFLDVGCGWGALLFHAVEHYGVRGVGITLSQQQHDFVTAEIAARGLGARMQVRLQHYNDVPRDEVFDKIASVGMFEHVGEANLPTYFSRLYELLTPGGLLLNHGITAGSPDNLGGLGSDISEFIEKYVFPGGELVHLARETELASRAGLEVLDVESLRPHYARTLWHWVERLEAHAAEAINIVGEERYRTWRIYMGGSAHAFERGWMSIYQLLAAKPLEDGSVPVPLTREHVYS